MKDRSNDPLHLEQMLYSGATSSFQYDDITIDKNVFSSSLNIYIIVIVVTITNAIFFII